MFKIDVICPGRVKKGPLCDLIDEYKRRIQWPLTIHEIESKHTDPQKTQNDEQQKILSYIKPGAIVIALDERGKTFGSLEFSKKIEKYKDHGDAHLQFVIGGADGLLDDVRKRANLLLSFGKQTWPHHLARVMLLEQIYRAQQILSGHPYHRE